MDNWKQIPLYQGIRKAAYSALRLLPVKRNKIIFNNFGGRGFGDDPKYIAQELLKRGEDLQLCWVVNDMQTPLPQGITPIQNGNFRTAIHYATAKVWVENFKGYYKPPKKKSQFYLQTWHSTLGFKMNEADASSLDPEYVKTAKRDAKMTDLMYSDNDFRLEKYRTRYWYDGPVEKCDVPRMSILHAPPETLVRQVRDAFGLKDQKIALYAPTFRDQIRYRDYCLDPQACIQALEERFGGKFVLLIRLHPNEIRLGGTIDASADDLRDACGYPDMQELLAAADVLITDYSGCMFDCGFVNKPVFLLTKDWDAYRETERGTTF